MITVVVVALAACSRSAYSPSNDAPTRSFKLVPANDPSAAPVDVTISVPGAWKVTGANPWQPAFEIPGGASGTRVTLTVMELTGSPAAMMQGAIDEMGLGDGQRTELSGDRLWFQETTDTMTHARIFVPYVNGFVMGVAFLPELDRLPDVRKALETLAVAP